MPGPMNWREGVSNRLSKAPNKHTLPKTLNVTASASTKTYLKCYWYQNKNYSHGRNAIQQLLKLYAIRVATNPNALSLDIGFQVKQTNLTTSS